MNALSELSLEYTLATAT